LRDVDDVFDQLGDGLVAFDGDGDDSAGAGVDFLNVAEGLLVLEELVGSVGPVVATQTMGRVSSMRVTATVIDFLNASSPGVGLRSCISIQYAVCRRRALSVFRRANTGDGGHIPILVHQISS
jgi:hypothetical protein